MRFARRKFSMRFPTILLLLGCILVVDLVTAVVAPPTNVRATSGDGRCTVYWTKSPTIGVIEYNVTSPLARRSKLAGPSDTSIDFDGLTNLVAYTFVIRARAEGESSPDS